MKPMTGATALIAIEAAALDTETTGLDPASARVVQIGAVAISAGIPRSDERFELLVDPGISIPQSSTRIHGISDDMVRGAPGFASACEGLRRFIGDRLVIGHSVGFDLAVLEQESRRTGVPWIRPRSLCVRLLSILGNPSLPDHSLEAISGWLGVDLRGRHSAIGDAVAAADIFVALLPHLQAKGIRTLAQAERACLALRNELEAAHRAGWSEPPPPAAFPAFQSVDPYAYIHRLGELMSSPPIVIAASTNLREAIGLMVRSRVSSLFVSESGEAGGPVGDYGIVTERDMMRRIAADGGNAFGMPVGDVASRPLASIRAQAFAYRAIGRMDRLKIRHLGVRDDAGNLVGIVSARDLLRLRASAAIDLDDAIDEAGSAGGLAAAWATLPAVARSLVAEAVQARTVCNIVSEELCALTRRAAILAERAMAEEGLGTPPCAYSLLVLGSGGRGESLLAADQDNAIVYAEGEPEGPQDRWFAALGARIADLLDAAGVPYCRGGVMARNPEFRGDVALWRSRIASWVSRSRPQDLLNVDIFFDLKTVHGDSALGAGLRSHAYELGHASPEFAKLLGEQIALSNPFTIFGGFRLEDGRIDLKKHGLFPIVASARTLAIRHDIRARSTRARLEDLIALDLGGVADLRALLSGHEFLLSLLLSQQGADLHSGIPVSNRVETASMNRQSRAELKAVLDSIQLIPDLVRDLMFRDQLR